MTLGLVGILPVASINYRGSMPLGQIGHVFEITVQNLLGSEFHVARN